MPEKELVPRLMAGLQNQIQILLNLKLNPADNSTSSPSYMSGSN
jgi:hypothetical protein